MRFSRFAPAAALSALLFGTGAAGQFLPQITLSPVSAAADAGDLKVTVQGKNFNQNMQGQWNGQPRATQFVSSRALKVTITSQDLAVPGVGQIGLIDNSTGAAAADPVFFPVYLALVHNDIAYDPLRGLIYVAVSAADPNGPSIAVFDPNSGKIARFIPLPAIPELLAISDDSRYLYVGLWYNPSFGGQAGLRRIDLSGSTADITRVFTDDKQALEILPLPGLSSSFAALLGLGPGDGIVLVVYDGATPRPPVRGGVGSFGCLSPGTDATAIYSGVVRITLTSSGGTAPASNPVALFGSGPCPVSGGGLLYGYGGEIVDPTIPALTGYLSASGYISPAPELNRVYVLGSDFVNTENHAYAVVPGNNRISVLNLQTGALEQTIRLQTIQGPANGQGRLIHWGQNGVAFGEYYNNSPNATAGMFKWLYVFSLPPNQ